MRNVISLLTISIALAACSAPVETQAEKTGKTKQAIDAVPVGEVPISQFYKLPKLTAATIPTLPHGVVNIAYLQHLPGLIWGLVTNESTQPLYKPCAPAFQTYEDACTNNYTLTIAECDAYETVDAQTCQANILSCQASYCIQNYNYCLDEIPICLDSSCLESDDLAAEACQEEQDVCDQNIAPGSICAHSFEVCLNTVMTQNSGCRDNAVYQFDACSNNVGTCI